VKAAKAPRSRSMLIGYSDARGISDMLIEGLEIEGHAIGSADEAKMDLLHVRDIRFEPRIK